MSLGENIRGARKAAGFSQEELGERLGVVSQTVSKWERDESSPDAALLPVLAEVLHVSLDRLFDRELSAEEIQAAVVRHLRPKSPEERSDFVLHLQRLSLELSLGITDGELSYPNMPEDFRYARLGKKELSYYHSSPDIPAAFLLREPERGWAALFEDSEDRRRLLEALGDAETLRAAKKILSMPAPDIVDRSALPRLLGLENPEKSVPLLRRLRLVHFETRIVDGQETEVCFFTPDPGLLAILSFEKLLFGDAHTPEFYVTAGGWHTRPPMYEGPLPDLNALARWYVLSDIM